MDCRFADISINISPRCDTAQAGEVNQHHVAPIIAMTHHPNDTSAADSQTPPPTPRTWPIDRHLRQDRSHRNERTPPRTFTVMRPETSFPAESSQVHSVSTRGQSPHPLPIYPLEPGEQAPPARTFSANRTHGYYVIFQGILRLGIYHEY